MIQYSLKEDITLENEYEVHEFFKRHRDNLLEYHLQTVEHGKTIRYVAYDADKNMYTCFLSFKAYLPFVDKFEMFKNNNPFMR